MRSKGQLSDARATVLDRPELGLVSIAQLKPAQSLYEAAPRQSRRAGQLAARTIALAHTIDSHSLADDTLARSPPAERAERSRREEEVGRVWRGATNSGAISLTRSRSGRVGGIVALAAAAATAARRELRQFLYARGGSYECIGIVALICKAAASLPSYVRRAHHCPNMAGGCITALIWQAGASLP